MEQISASFIPQRAEDSPSQKGPVSHCTQFRTCRTAFQQRKHFCQEQGWSYSAFGLWYSYVVSCFHLFPQPQYPCYFSFSFVPHIHFCLFPTHRLCLLLAVLKSKGSGIVPVCAHGMRVEQCELLSIVKLMRDELTPPVQPWPFWAKHYCEWMIDSNIQAETPCICLEWLDCRVFSRASLVSYAKSACSSCVFHLSLKVTLSVFEWLGSCPSLK